MGLLYYCHYSWHFLYFDQSCPDFVWNIVEHMICALKHRISISKPERKRGENTHRSLASSLSLASIAQACRSRPKYRGVLLNEKFYTYLEVVAVGVKERCDHTTALRISTRFSDFVACLAKIMRKSNLFDRQPGRQKILTTDRNRRHCPFKFFTQVAISTTFWRRLLAVCNNTTV